MSLDKEIKSFKETGILTYNILYEVTRKSYDKLVADDITGPVIERFGSNEEVMDAELDKSTRDVFYMMEEKGILTTRRYDDTLPSNSTEWRTHVWIYKKGTILSILSSKKKLPFPIDKAEKLYNTMPASLFEEHAKKMTAYEV